MLRRYISLTAAGFLCLSLILVGSPTVESKAAEAAQPSACEAPFTVLNSNDSGPGSLRQAILDAGACPDGIVDFDAALSGQTITLASTLEINSDLTVDGSSLSEHVKISGNDSVRVMRVDSVATVTLDSLDIIDGYSQIPDPGVPASSAGGIRNDGTLTLANSLISGNMAQSGGGIYNSGMLTVISSTFSNNTATYGSGGGIHNYGTLVVRESIFSGNTAEVLLVGASGGGGVYSTGMLTVTDSTFANNSAPRGAALFSYGGGIYANGTATVRNSTFTGNSAEAGGGIASESSMTLENNTIAGNSAACGGGIWNGGNLYLTNSTISGNSLISGNCIGPGTGLYNAWNLYMRNTILANSTNGWDCVSKYKLVEDVNNLVENNGSCGTPLLTADPMLGSLADNGGSTQTIALLTGSPAIDKGDASYCPPTDQRGVTRPQGSACDLGAYEVEAPAEEASIFVYLPVLKR